jgi:hypothetical protein
MRKRVQVKTEPEAISNAGFGAVRRLATVRSTDPTARHFFIGIIEIIDFIKYDLINKFHDME